MKPEMIVHAMGGRKNILGYVYLGCSTFLVNAMLIGRHEPDFVGMATVIGALATGVVALVWGNVKEHENKRKPEEAIQ
jgi:hypothetical protein